MLTQDKCIDHRSSTTGNATVVSPPIHGPIILRTKTTIKKPPFREPSCGSYSKFRPAGRIHVTNTQKSGQLYLAKVGFQLPWVTVETRSINHLKRLVGEGPGEHPWRSEDSLAVPLVCSLVCSLGYSPEDSLGYSLENLLEGPLDDSLEESLEDLPEPSHCPLRALRMSDHNTGTLWLSF